jgi:putative nucleotidyltransferase with HDIG domain
MSSTTVSCPIAVHDAHDIAQVVLSGLPTRWRHTVGVARRAEELTDLLDPYERDTLVAAAWLHDIGYAEELVDTGFHPLDGAQFLDRYRWPQRICGLVAHHSGAAYAAADRGLAAALAVHPDERSMVADLLTYASRSVPAGHRRPRGVAAARRPLVGDFVVRCVAR